ncbi:FAD-binding oxidoreductase [bacterium]|nr:FAD-binding oxidoreductase [bacterium]
MTATDNEYENLRSAKGWNQLTPKRYPRLIVQVANEQDVIEAIHFARANQMRIAVRGGGHSWVGFSLREDSLLIDLGRLKQTSIDPVARIATVQPTVTGRELHSQLKTHGLSFPVGHCPTVPVSGFLLSGGLGWNTSTWGPGCFSVTEAKIVTADGNLVTVNQQNNPDLFWAVRGAGPGFFGVVTEYKLRLYPAPRAITTSTYFYPVQHIAEVGAWAGSISGLLPKELEFTLFIAQAPPHLSEQCRSEKGYVAILSAIAFVDTTSEATAALNLLESCPVLNQCVEKEIIQPSSLDALLDLGEMLWPKGHRYLVDTVWTNSPPADPLVIVRDSFLHAPSPKSLAVCVFSTGAENNASTLPDAAFSMTGRTLFLCYAIWEQQENDAVNAAWHRTTIAELEPFAVGHYVGESDIVAKPTRVERSFAPANWQRLQALRLTFDPDGLFHGHFSSVE